MLSKEEFAKLYNQGLSVDEIKKVKPSPSQDYSSVFDIKKPEKKKSVPIWEEPSIRTWEGFTESMAKGAQAFEPIRKYVADPLTKIPRTIVGTAIRDLQGLVDPKKKAEPILGITPMSAQSPKQILGLAAETSSYLPFGQAAKLGLKAIGLTKTVPTLERVAQVAKTAIPGMLGGGLALGGLAAQEDKTPVEIANQAAIGAGIGAVAAPALAGSIGYIAKKLQPPTISEATQRFRDAFNIHKSDINRIEKEAGKDLDDVLQFSLEEVQGTGVVPVKSGNSLDLRDLFQKEVRNAEGVVTQKAGLHRERAREIDVKLDSVLDDSFQQHNLNDIRAEAKAGLGRIEKNAVDLKKMEAIVDNEIDTVIEKYGRETLTDRELHEFKKGMWGIGYDINNQLRSPVGRRLGYIAKDRIHASNPELSVQRLNYVSGMHQQAVDLFEGIHGNVIKGGRLEGWFSRFMGSYVMSHLLGEIPGIKQVAPIIGNFIGKHYHEFVRDPARIARDAINMARKAGLDARSKEIINEFEKNIPLLKGRQFLEELQRNMPSTKNLLPPGTPPVKPQYTGQGTYVPGTPKTPTEPVLPLQGPGILQGQEKLKAPVNRSFQESSGVPPQYPPVLSEQRMLPPGVPRPPINQGRAIPVAPTGPRSVERIGTDKSIEQPYSPLPGTAGGRTDQTIIKFDHYGTTPGLSELDPAFAGTGAPGTERAQKAALPDVYVPSTYFYNKGQKPEGIVAEGSKAKYSGVFKGKLLTKDSEEFKSLVEKAAEEVRNNPEKYGAYNDDKGNALLTKLIKDAGYDGVDVPGYGFTSFKKVPVKGETPTTLPKTEKGDSIVEHIGKNGGITISLEGDMPRAGYAYSPYKTEKPHPLETFSDKDLEKFKNANLHLLTEKGNYIGGWIDGNTVYLDVSKVGKDFKTVYKAAEALEEKGISDLSGEPYPTTIYTKHHKDYGTETNVSNIRKRSEPDGEGVGSVSKVPKGGGGGDKGTGTTPFNARRKSKPPTKSS